MNFGELVEVVSSVPDSHRNGTEDPIEFSLQSALVWAWKFPFQKAMPAQVGEGQAMIVREGTKVLMFRGPKPKDEANRAGVISVPFGSLRQARIRGGTRRWTG